MKRKNTKDTKAKTEAFHRSTASCLRGCVCVRPSTHAQATSTWTGYWRSEFGSVYEGSNPCQAAIDRSQPSVAEQCHIINGSSRSPGGSWRSLSADQQPSLAYLPYVGRRSELILLAAFVSMSDHRKWCVLHMSRRSKHVGHNEVCVFWCAEF
eukprot:6473145-Amphidinium_carterae.2